MNLGLSKWVGVLGTCAALSLPLAAGAAVVNVGSNQLVTYAGITATAGQVFQLSATGTVELANRDGHYVTDANGAIVTPPIAGSGAYNYFSGQPLEGGLVAGGKAYITPYFGNGLGVLVNAAYGGLLAGFSRTLNPTGLGDFVGGFSFVGAAAELVAPVDAPYLFLAVNDTNRFDNSGAFSVDVSVAPVPEPASLALVLAGLGAGVATRRRRG